MTDEKFFAWLDGELPPMEAATVAAEVAADSALAAKADQHRAFATRLKAAFDPLLADAHAMSSANIINFGVARERRRLWLRSPTQWMAIAATLVVGLVTTSLFFQPEITPRDDQPVLAGGALGAALDTQLASAPDASLPIRIGLTFRDKQGALCRSFTQTGSSGLACHVASGGWRLRGVFATDGTPDGGSDYRMATGSDSRLSALIDETIAGDPLDARAEADVRRKRWH